MHELVVRGGTVIDGTGADRRVADVAIDGGVVTEVGQVADPGEQEIDATGMLVTPGFVDIHTHYDGQVSWDPLLTPSSWHGVTTVVMGNCGVGFAPVRPDRHDWLISLMEGVEDIPGSALAEGIDWTWESFPEYLDAIDATPHAIDIGTQVPHGALRAYVMGERAAADVDATPEEVAEMARLTREAVLAGALGFTTSRTRAHKSADGSYIPTLGAPADELLAIAAGMGATGEGVFEIVSDFIDFDAEFGLMRAMAETTGRPLSITFAQNDRNPHLWKKLLECVEEAVGEGIPMRLQVSGRPIGLLMGWQTSMHPFIGHPAYKAIASLPLPERVARLRDPELRAQLVAERTDGRPAGTAGEFHKMFPLGEPPDYEPAPETSIAAIAAREGRRPAEVAYDRMLQSDGQEMLYFPLLNYSQMDLEPTRELLEHPLTVLGLSDGGAHCGVICDASLPTSMLIHWGRDRTRGDKLGLEWLVQSQTRDTARAVGLKDRGVLAPGMRADLNVIDFDALTLGRPEMVFDLPAGGRRLVQKAEGYVATVVAGEVTFRHGEHTGALPGRLIRGAQS